MPHRNMHCVNGIVYAYAFRFFIFKNLKDAMRLLAHATPKEAN